MASSTAVVVVALAYLGLLFAIAWYGDRRAQSGRSLIHSPLVYTLSLGVYCTSWTFYGAVGTAARRGVEFITIYTGPTIVFLGWWFLLRKIARISKSQRITSIADFIASRYGKSALLGVLVTVIATVGAMPYIALQLKAVSTSFAVLVNYTLYADINGTLTGKPPSILGDAAFLTAIGMAIFAILFGTRHIDANEHHEGMVAAIAFESCVKFLAFLAVGVYVVLAFGPGIGSAEAKLKPVLDNLVLLPQGDAARFITMTFLSMAAIICLPRQFHITIVENVNERHLATAAWLFPLYLLMMSLFALPIAAAGLTLLPAEANPDFYVLTVPITQGQHALALLAFIGGLSSATAMVVVAAIALSTMVCNDVVMPVSVAHPLVQARCARRPHPASPVHPPGGHLRHPAARLRLLPGDRRIRVRWPRSAWSPSPWSRNSCRPWSAGCSGAMRRAPARRPDWRSASSPGAIRCWCRCFRAAASCRRRSSPGRGTSLRCGRRRCSG